MFDSRYKIRDHRLLATVVIAGSSVFMLGLCVPLCMITHSDLLPYLTIAGSALATASVWVFGRPKNPEDQSKKVAQLQATIEDLKERLENVEVIHRFESGLAERSAAVVDQGQVGGIRAMGELGAEE